MTENTGKTKEITNIAEFADQKLEKEFFTMEFRNTIKYLKPFMLALGLFYLAFMLLDLYVVRDPGSLRLILADRLFVILVIFILYIHTKPSKDAVTMSYWLTACEIISVVSCFFVYYMYEPRNFLVQACAVMVTILIIFTIPNRWIFMVAAASFAEAGFLILTAFIFRTQEVPILLLGIMFITAVFVFSALWSYRISYYKRVEYLKSKELLRISITDPLTGAYNRIKFDREMDYWIGYSRRYKVPLSLVILDFDNFKEINDKYGHMVGDSVLREAVELLNTAVRQCDILARWGGEEFTLLLPHTGRPQAIEMAERLRSRIASHGFMHVGGVTCSFGVATLDDANTDHDGLLRQADIQLYSAKHAGKNAVAG